jgi:predicted DNA-binding transcriptional regulator AlpA
VKMATDTLLVREVAQRLGIERADVYHLLATGVLYGRPDRIGDMRVSRSSVEEYEASQATSA